MSNNGFAIVSLVAVLGLAACSSVQFGREFSVTTFETRAEQGVTTREQVRGWLGDPSSIGRELDIRGERLEVWTYYSGKGQLPDLKDAAFKMLQVKFDQGGRLRAYTWSGESR